MESPDGDDGTQHCCKNIIGLNISCISYLNISLEITTKQWGYFLRHPLYETRSVRPYVYLQT